MESFFTPDYNLFWALVLAAALFYPVRQLIWVLYVRRADRRGGADDEARQVLKRRATATSALICFVFSFFYTMQLFSGA